MSHFKGYSKSSGYKASKSDLGPSKVKIKLGPKAIKNFGYSVEDVGSGKIKYHGNKAAQSALRKKIDSK